MLVRWNANHGPPPLKSNAKQGDEIASTTAPGDQAAVSWAILLLANRWMVAVTVSPLGGRTSCPASLLMARFTSATAVYPVARATRRQRIGVHFRELHSALTVSRLPGST